jgi:hypothetical protein
LVTTAGAQGRAFDCLQSIRKGRGVHNWNVKRSQICPGWEVAFAHHFNIHFDARFFVQKIKDI